MFVHTKIAHVNERSLIVLQLLSSNSSLSKLVAMTTTGYIADAWHGATQFSAYIHLCFRHHCRPSPTSSMDSPIPRRVDKGKARAQEEPLTENTPLLASTSGSSSSSRAPSIEHPNAARRRLYSRLVSVFLISLSFCVLLFALIAVVAYSWRSRASTTRPEEIIQRALVVRGPDKVGVLSYSPEEGIWLLVEGRMGLDAGSVAGVKSDEDDSVWRNLWKSVGRWSIRRLERVTVELSRIDVSPRSHPNISLASIWMPPFEVPLTADPPPRDLSWLTPVKIPLRIQPTNDTHSVLEFVRESWKNGYLSVQGLVAQAAVHGGGQSDSGWRSLFEVSHTDVRPVINLKSAYPLITRCPYTHCRVVPHVPGLPHPGPHSPYPEFADFVTLRSFQITSTDDNIYITANASAINPAPEGLEFTAPHLPFIIALPTPGNDAPSVPVVSVQSAPFQLTHPNISLALRGTVIPLPRNSSSALSAFVGEYINGRDADIQITTTLIPGLTINTTFPAPHPRPDILHNVTISDMKIRPAGTTMLASGVVHALVVLPRGINVGVNATRVFPDVLIFDGAVPDSPGEEFSSGSPPPTKPLPDPLPPGAFAHIVPEDWLPAECHPVEGPAGSGSAVAVSAQIVDVPLEVLPGRQREFSDFVSKVNVSVYFLRTPN